jgi:hypothetical protein
MNLIFVLEVNCSNGQKHHTWRSISFFLDEMIQIILRGSKTQNSNDNFMAEISGSSSPAPFPKPVVPEAQKSQKPSQTASQTRQLAAD